MAKKIKSYRGASKVGGRKLLEKIGATVLGMAAGTAISNFLQKKDASGADVMGLSGETSDYVAPAIIAAAGVVGTHLTKSNDFVRQACIGLAAAGGAGLVNRLTNKAIVALNGNDAPVSLPGFGSTEYVQLPGNNELATQYDPDRQPIGDADGYDLSDGESPALAAEEVAEPQSISGVEEAAIY